MSGHMFPNMDVLNEKQCRAFLITTNFGHNLLIIGTVGSGKLFSIKFIA